MEKALIIIGSIALLIVVVFFVLGQLSQSGEAPGLAEGRLTQCPGTPNCVNSEFTEDTGHYIEPLDFAAEEAAQVLPRLKAIIGDMGGSIVSEQDDYLAARFSSSIFRFVDDLELRVDSAQNRVHLRSASRVGRSDYDANRKRVELLKARFHSQTG